MSFVERNILVFESSKSDVSLQSYGPYSVRFYMGLLEHFKKNLSPWKDFNKNLTF